MTIPVLVDVLGHLDHPARDDLGIESVLAISLEVAVTMTVRTALVRGHPFRHRRHQPVEVGIRQSAQNLNVLVDVPGQFLTRFRDDGIICQDQLDRRIGRRQVRLELGHRHAGSARAGLHAVCCKGLPPGHQKGRNEDRPSYRPDKYAGAIDVFRILAIPVIKPLGKHLNSPVR